MTEEHLIFYQRKSDIHVHVAQGSVRLGSDCWSAVRPIDTTFSQHHGLVLVWSKNLTAAEDGKIGAPRVNTHLPTRGCTPYF
jgi:hypothetical protein